MSTSGGECVEGVTAAHKEARPYWATLAIVEGRVRLLIVEEEFAQSGWECPNCGFIGAARQERCPLCGAVLNPQPDIVELALERVLDQDGEPEVLRSPESRQALAQHGRIGALLRYISTSAGAAEGEQSDLQKAAQEATPTPDDLVDEALKETFPASDPPFWMPPGGEK
jgi:hypothetical protein